MLEGILLSAAVLGVIGCMIAIMLNFAGEKFYVRINENTEKVRELLPGSNCGGCGYAGCDALAAAIAEGEAAVGACPVGGQKTAEQIAALLGKKAEKSVRMVAFVHCGGDCDKAARTGVYFGPQDCVSAKAVQANGGKACLYGCMGYGSCVQACEFGALDIYNGVCRVDKEKCRACGKCIEACPNALISFVPYDAAAWVACASQERGPAVKKQCSAGCIGCTLCTRQCEAGAIHMEGNVARIDYELCTGCGACAEKCPSKCILLDCAKPASLKTGGSQRG